MADIAGVAYTLISAILAAAAASAMGYWKKTVLPDGTRQAFDPQKLAYTVVYGIALATVGLGLGIPALTPPEVVEAKLMETGYYALFLYGTQAFFQFLWRRVLAPAYAKIQTLGA